MAAAWAAIALTGATSIAFMLYLGTRIDGLGTEFRTAIDAQTARIDALSARIDAQSTELSARIDAQGAELGARIDRLTARMDTHLQQRHAG